MKVLVAGCAGFLGSHIVDRLLESHCRVFGIDNFLSGSQANLMRALGNPRFEFAEADVVEPVSGTADLVLNLACPASPPRYQADPIHTMRTSVVGTLNLADVAIRSGGRIVHASTSEVYGDPEIHPQAESYKGAVNPIGPRACYDEGKRAAESILFDSRRMRGLDIGVCRIFNTYGPRMDPYDGRVVSNFVRQALLGEPLTIYGDGRQTRSFCYVDDTVDGILRLAAAGPDVTGPVNIGNPTEITILELAEAIRDLLDVPVTIEWRPRPADDPVRRRPDITRAHNTLGWAPKVGLREGLGKTIDDFDDLVSRGRLADLGRLRNAAA
jgi:UDP-glucuronate decarboxylase